MDLSRYFVDDDGSLPEIEISFADSSRIPDAFRHLFNRGARDFTKGGATLWSRETQADRPFAGPEDSDLVISGLLEPFHILLGGITGGGVPVPDLGVLVSTDGLTIDYRMGPGWGEGEVQSLMSLLRQLQALGGVVSVPWWGDERDFQTALSGA